MMTRPIHGMNGTKNVANDVWVRYLWTASAPFTGGRETARERRLWR